MTTTQNGGEFAFKTTIDPPQVRIPLSLEGAPEAKWYQGQATILYQIWDALIKLGTAESTIISDEGVGGQIDPYIVACSDEFTPITAGTQKVTFRMPYAATLTGLSASLVTAATGSVFTVDIGKNGVSILSTKLTIDAGETSSLTAAAAAVISDDTFALDDIVRVDVTTVGSSYGGNGLKVTFKFDEIT
jgi:hypothetical protein